MTSRNVNALAERVRVNRQGTTFADLKRLLEAAGFEMHPRNGGTHRAFSKPGCFVSPTIPEMRGPVKVAYVSLVLRVVKECTDE